MELWKASQTSVPSGREYVGKEGRRKGLSDDGCP